MYPKKPKQEWHLRDIYRHRILYQKTYRLTDETVHVLRIAGVVWNSETSITDSHLALSKWKSEEAELIEETAQCLYRENTPGKCDSNIVDQYDDTAILMLVINNDKYNSPSNPNICLCCYDLSTVEVDHLWCTVWQSSIPSFIKSGERQDF